MNLKYALFLIVCVIASVLVTLKFGPNLLLETDATTSPQETSITKAQGDAILKELATIRTTLEKIEKLDRSGNKRPKVPPTASVSIKDRPMLGDANATVTVVEFTDYQCPYCRRFMKNTYPRLKKEYIDTGKIRWVVRDMPLGFHKQARLAATAVHCAGDQDKLWEFRDLLYHNQTKLMPEHLEQYASQVGIDTATFNSCLNSDRYQADIDKDAEDAAKEKITGTPTFVIGKADKNNIVNGKRIVGAQSYAAFRIEIERLLKAATGI